jgi:hypothetical protein
MSTISLCMPADVIADLKQIAPLLGFSGYQPLIRAYIGQGLRSDMARLEKRPDLSTLVESLRRHGVPEGVITSVVAESRGLRRMGSQGHAGRPQPASGSW